MSRIVTIAFALLLAAGGALADTELSSSPVGPSPGGKGYPLAAAGPNDFFVAWLENRSGRVHLFGTRMAADGTRIHPGGKLIETIEPRAFAISPELAWVDGRYVVTLRWIHVEADQPSQPRWLRLTLDDANVIDRQSGTGELPRPWPANATGQTIEIVTSGGNVVAWFTDAVRGRWPSVIASGGTVLGVLPDGEDWLILFRPFGASGVRWYRVSGVTGGVIGSRFVTRLPAATYTIASRGLQFGVLSEERNGSTRTLRFVVLGQDGAETSVVTLLSDSAQPPPTVSAPPSGEAWVVPDVDAWLVAFSWYGPMDGRHEMRVYRVTDSRFTEMRLPVARQMSDGGWLAPMLAVGVRNLLLFHRLRDFSESPHGHDLVAYTFDRGTLPRESDGPVFLSEGRPMQGAPAAEGGPRGTLAAWREGDTRGDILVRFFPTYGAPGAAARISDALDARNPVVKRNGETFLVAWVDIMYNERLFTERSRVLVRRFDTDGMALDPEPLVVYGGRHGDVSVAAEGDGFRLAWTGGPSTSDTRVRSMRIPARGAIEDEPELDSFTEPYVRAGSPAVAGDGHESIVLWIEQPLNRAELRGRRILSDGRTRATAMLELTETFVAAARPGELIVAFTTSPDATQTRCVQARRYSFAGQPLAPAETLHCKSGIRASSVVWDGERWLVAIVESSGAALRDVWTLDAEGRVTGTIEALPPELGASAPRLFVTQNGAAAVYVRPGEGDWIPRGYMRSLQPPSKRRAARH